MLRASAQFGMAIELPQPFSPLRRCWSGEAVTLGDGELGCYDGGVRAVRRRKRIDHFSWRGGL
jgi:hypothetical protein